MSQSLVKEDPVDSTSNSSTTMGAKCCPILSQHKDSEINRAEVDKLLAEDHKWDFDVIKLEYFSRGQTRPLELLGMSLLLRFNALEILKIDEGTLRNWLICIESNYHRDNPYHNSTHSADVLQATAYFLSTDRLKTFLPPFDKIVCLLAAIVHDIDHPGKTSPFLINSKHELAILYNDISVLESHHAAYTFKVTLTDSTFNIFKNLDTPTFNTLRRSLIDMVLATEMAKHMEHMGKFENVFLSSFSKHANAAFGGDDRLHELKTPENVLLVKRMLIKCSDVSNPARPLKMCVEWSKRITEEYFLQTDEEKKRSIPLTMPIFDREKCSVPKAQTGFIDFFCRDMFEAWNSFLGVRELLDYMDYNYKYWKYLEQGGHKNSVYLENYTKDHPFVSSEFLRSASTNSLPDTLLLKGVK